MAVNPYPFLRRKSQTVDTDALATVTSMLAVDLGTTMGGKKLLVHNVRLKHISGSATTNTLRVYEDSTATAEDVTMVAKAPAIAVATQITRKDLTGPSASHPFVVKCDTAGKFYLQPNPDDIGAPVDNKYRWVVDYECCSQQAGDDA